MQPKLEGYVAARLGPLERTVLASVARDFAALEQTILGNADLHGLLTDTSINAVARGQVLGDLLVGKVADLTVDLAVYAAVEVPAQERHETGVAEFASLGLLAARERVCGYADAVLGDVTTDNFTEIEHDLFRWAHIVRNNNELRRLLTDRDAPLEERLGITRSLLEGKVHEIALALACFVIVGGRPRDVTGSIDHLVDYIALARDWRIARIHSAQPLDEVSRAQLVTSLMAVTGRSVELQVAQDPSLLGGLLIEVGDLRLDATTRGRLGALRDAVASGRLYESALNRND
jgi:F-type H+-transporting ATPase subunit delta